MKKSFFLAAFCAVSVILTGCGATTAERENKASQLLASGNLDQAKREIESAQRQAQKEGASQDVRDRLATQLAEVNRRLAARAISQEDDARAAGAAALRAAKASADARNWKQMSRELSSAKGHAKKANDPALNAAIDAMVQSQPVKLAGARAAYSAMCSKAGWSTAIEIFDGDPFWLDLSAVLDRRLERAVEDVGDQELRDSGYLVAKEWREYIRAKEIEKSTRNDNSGIGILINAGAAGARVKNRIEYMQAQTRFEKRLNEMQGSTTMPASSYAPSRRDQPAAPARVASAPLAPGTPRTPGSTASVPAGVPVAPSNTALATAPRTEDPPPADPVVTDRSTPNFDDLR